MLDYIYTSIDNFENLMEVAKKKLKGLKKTLKVVESVDVEIVNKENLDTMEQEVMKLEVEVKQYKKAIRLLYKTLAVFLDGDIEHEETEEKEEVEE